MWKMKRKSFFSSFYFFLSVGVKMREGEERFVRLREEIRMVGLQRVRCESERCGVCERISTLFSFSFFINNSYYLLFKKNH